MRKQNEVLKVSAAPVPRMVGIWYSWDGDIGKDFKFNHISDDVPNLDDFQPKPLNKYQEVAWKGKSWKARVGILDKDYHLLEELPFA